MKFFLLALFLTAVCAQDAAAEKATPATTAAAKSPLDAKYARFCPTDRAKCADKDFSCPTWAAAKPSECTANPDWMLPNCAKSCCPICTEKPKPKPVTCPTDAKLCKKNAHTSCHAWANQKDKPQCTANPNWMIPNCQQSCCDVCKTDSAGCPTVRDTCANSYAVPDAEAGDKKCVDWAKAGECKTNAVWMSKHCSKSCCPVCAPKPPATARAAPLLNNWNYNPQPFIYRPFNTNYTTTNTLPAYNFGGYNTDYNFGGYNANYFPYGYGR